MQNKGKHQSKLIKPHPPPLTRYLEGGIDGGFQQVEKLEYRKKLYHIKGRRKIRITQTKVIIIHL